MKDIMMVILIVSGILATVAFMLIGSQLINITCFDNIPSTAYVNDKIVYKGSSAGISVKSTGDTTELTIVGGFLYFFPQKNYVGRNIRVEGEK
jgi:hypothetical protein